MNKKEAFIEKSKKRHGDKYDYSKINYLGSEEKICIVCPKHGEFWQTPAAHVRGNGCPKCANEKRGRFKRMSTEEFIERAKKIHGDKYDYSKVEYVNSATKVCIICPKHGEFWMMPVDHIYQQKQGCPKCSNRGLSSKEIIKMFKNVHGDKYDYSKVEYTKMHDKVCIICPIHGEFWQTPSKHLKKQGCKKCGIEKRTKEKTKTTEQFIKEAKAVHGNKYDYSNTTYEYAFGKVHIICPKHGEFLQRAFDHIHNHGCPMCGESSLEREITLLLDENKILFAKQKRFSWLGKQSLDFYLPKYNVAIECQGEQHSKPIELFGGENEFEKIKERDLRKKTICEKNGIKILYYSNIKHDDWINDKSFLLKEIKKS